MDILGFARSKIRGVLDTLEEITALDFPFQHAREALLELGNTFKNIEKTLGSLGPYNDPATVNACCHQALEALSRKRSADPRSRRELKVL